SPVAATRLDVPQIEVCRRCALVAIDRLLESLRGPPRVALAQRLFAELVFEEGEDGLIARGGRLAVHVGELPADLVGFGPLVLFFVQLLQLYQRMPVLRVESQYFLERFVGPVDEAAASEVEAQAEQDVGVLQRLEPRTLQQSLMDVNG